MLHAPGVCQICDVYAAEYGRHLDVLREAWGINFTGVWDQDKYPCPSEGMQSQWVTAGPARANPRIIAQPAHAGGVSSLTIPPDKRFDLPFQAVFIEPPTQEEVTAAKEALQRMLVDLAPPI